MRNRSRLAAFAAVLSATACAPLAEQSPAALIAASPAGMSDYQRGKADLGAGNYGLALTHFSAALAKDPENVAALNGKAIALAKLGEDAAAAETFERALNIDDHSPLTRANYAIFAEHRGDRVKTNAVAAAPEPTAQAPTPVAAPQAAAPAAAPEAIPHITIANGSGQYHLAHRLKTYLAGRGFAANRIANAAQFGRSQSILFCHAQSRDAAESIRKSLPANVKVVVLLSNSNSVELVAGRDLDNFDTRLALLTPTTEGATR